MAEATRRQKTRILVAEDVHTNQQIIVEMIGLLGHEVEIAPNGQIAVEKYASGKYSLVFMDCQMPVMDGYTATRKLRRIEMERNMPRVPIVALTAGSDNEDKVRCRQAGMDGYLTKPFSISDIKMSIDKYLQSDLLTSEPGHSNAPASDIENLRKSSKSDETKVIDLSAIENIKEIERQTGRLILPSIFEGYVEQMEEKLREIERNIRAEDCISIYRTAHAIKSMSANIGAEKVRLISADMEKKGKEGDLSSLSGATISLADAYHEFLIRFETDFTNEQAMKLQ
jgi:CheY-like chemotaxis protein